MPVAGNAGTGCCGARRPKVGKPALAAGGCCCFWANWWHAFLNSGSLAQICGPAGSRAAQCNPEMDGAAFRAARYLLCAPASDLAVSPQLPADLAEQTQAFGH